MPLSHGSSKESFSSNVSELMHSGRPQKQALAIAYRVKREGRAMGGPPSQNPPWFVRNEARGMTHGALNSPVPGRTDHLPITVGSGSFVLPADHVSHLGQGNSQAGHAVINSMFSPGGPYGSGASPITRGRGAPPAPKSPKLASGGAPKAAGQPVPIMAAGGEHVLSPEEVEAVGLSVLKRAGAKGTPSHDHVMKAGHEALDHWVIETRKKNIKTLRGLPGPASS